MRFPSLALGGSRSDKSSHGFVLESVVKNIDICALIYKTAYFWIYERYTDIL